MKKFKRFAIGGIQNKIFNLILFTVILLAAAFMIVTQIQNNILNEIVADANAKQEDAISASASSVLNQINTTTLERSNRTEALLANEMFEVAGDSVAFLADFAENLLAHPDKVKAQPVPPPDPRDDGTWTAKAIYADGTDPKDPAVEAKVGLLGNMMDDIISLCPSFSAANAYVALPEGVHLSVSDMSSSWFEDGRIKSYDPRERGWYQKAVEEGGLVFTDGEWDANTGAYCIECAMPAYGPDKSLQAVIGADLYLTEMEEVLQSSSLDGEYSLLINQNGHAVLAPQEEAFPMADSDRGEDLRNSQHKLLASVVESALEGKKKNVVIGQLEDGLYYITASTIEETGWVLLSAYNQRITSRSTSILQAKLQEIQEESTRSYQAEKKRLRDIARTIFIIAMLVTLCAALWLGRRIVRPLNTITKQISELNEENLVFKMEDSYRTGDEVELLAESFATISEKTRTYMNEIVKVTAEKERIGAELSLANEIQAAMLPHIFPAFPERPDFDIYASMNPAKEVGGDFYDYFLVDDDHLCMVMADVSGKGVPAALFMMASKIILQSVTMLGNSPKEILTKTNDALCSNNEAEMFVTVWLGILQLSTGRLIAANAGHEYPVLKAPDGGFELYKDKHGFVIGGMEGLQYQEYELNLAPGSKLFLYTDGVPEATNAKNELFGTNRMVEALNEVKDGSPQDVLTGISRSVERFVDGAEQFDDLTMLCLEYVGPVQDGSTEGSSSASEI